MGVVSTLETTAVAVSEIHRKLSSLLSVVKDEENVLILMHDNPDPDSIASALGLQYLLENLAKRPSLIAYSGIVGRAENRAMLKHLGIKMCSVSRISLQDYACVALVDTQPLTGNNALPPEKSPKIIIDHHPLRPASRNVLYREIKPRYNVTASIISEYLIASKLEITPILATALFYAIKSETEGLAREVGKVEARLRHYLYPHVDQKLLANIENARVSREYFRIIHSALEHCVIYDDVVIADIENVSSPDIVAEVADLVMRLDKITWGFSIGTYNGDILISARTIDRAHDAGSLIRKAVGELGSAGGHEMMAGAKINVKDKSPVQKKRLVKQLVQRLLELTGNHSTRGENLINTRSEYAS
jgi:nanoRNase/pAp phosphatase (c-di-AMP/oligoRNAs hydrolase)